MHTVADFVLGKSASRAWMRALTSGRISPQTLNAKFKLGVDDFYLKQPTFIPVLQDSLKRMPRWVPKALPKKEIPTAWTGLAHPQTSIELPSLHGIPSVGALGFSSGFFAKARARKPYLKKTGDPLDAGFNTQLNFIEAPSRRIEPSGHVIRHELGHWKNWIGGMTAPMRELNREKRMLRVLEHRYAVGSRKPQEALSEAMAEFYARRRSTSNVDALQAIRSQLEHAYGIAPVSGIMPTPVTPSFYNLLWRFAPAEARYRNFPPL